MSAVWEVFALKYADRNARIRADSFIMDPHHDVPHPMDYFVWVLRNGSHTILVDTGYEETEAESRGRPIIERPAKMLADMGIDAATLDTVIITHLHYDHAGTLADFPNARFYLQPAEMAYATGPCMCHPHLRKPFTGDHVCTMVNAVHSERVVFIEGSGVVADGVEVHLIGGHSRGLQCVRVHTRRGWIVLASDASHFYENFLESKPFPIVADVHEMLTGFTQLRQLADSEAHVVPGHDPLVMQRFPLIAGSDRIVGLHADPLNGNDV